MAALRLTATHPWIQTSPAISLQKHSQLELGLHSDSKVTNSCQTPLTIGSCKPVMIEDTKSLLVSKQSLASTDYEKGSRVVQNHGSD